MPEHSGTFRIGDRVEIARIGTVRERFRGRRGIVIETAADEAGRLRLRLDNPPTDSLGREEHGGRWRPRYLRLVERTIQSGDQVRVADPAHVDGDGPVSEDFYGQVCTARAMRPSGSSWTVVHPDGGSLTNVVGSLTNVVDTEFLTVVNHGLETVRTEETPSSFPFVEGAPVQVSDHPAYYEIGGSSGDVDAVFRGATGELHSNYDDERWQVMLPTGERNTIHRSSLTVLGPPVPRAFGPGDRVHVAADARTSAGPLAPASGMGAMDGIVLSCHPGGVYKVRPLNLNQPYVVHETWLTAVERAPITAGETVQAVVHPRYRRSHDTMSVGGAVASIGGRVGTVLRGTNENGNVRVAFAGHGNEFIHQGFLNVLTPEEAAAVMAPGDLVRVAEDAEFAGSQVSTQVRGRVGSLERYDQGYPAWVVITPGGMREWVAVEGLTKLDRNLPIPDGHFRCGGCHQPAPTTEQVMGDGLAYCQECSVECVGCESRHPTVLSNYYDGDWHCRSCLRNCSHCGSLCPTGDMTNNPDSGLDYCRSCARTCDGDDCEEMIWGGSHFSCSACRADGPSGLIWRHTVPEMWLGGPVRKDGGYYLGFENEISAHGHYRLNPLRQWAETNLGSRDGLDLKSDSSVRGFEIATQPMTPAYFEATDWDSFFEIINEAYPITRSQEPDSHGLHVHIGRQAFRRPKWNKRTKRTVMVTDDGMIAAFSYLLAHHTDHLTRIARRAATGYCETITSPVKVAVSRQEKQTVQKHRLRGVGAPRGAVNLTNTKTIEIRAFRAARSTQELKDAVRLCYVATEYVRFLRSKGAISPAMLAWSAFSMWVASVHPQAFASISGLDAGKVSPEMAVDLAELAKEAERFKSQPVSKDLNRVMETGESEDWDGGTAMPEPMTATLRTLRVQMEEAAQAATTFTATMPAQTVSWEDLIVASDDTEGSVGEFFEDDEDDLGELEDDDDTF